MLLPVLGSSKKITGGSPINAIATESLRLFPVGKRVPKSWISERRARFEDGFCMFFSERERSDVVAIKRLALISLSVDFLQKRGNGNHSCDSIKS